MPYFELKKDEVSLFIYVVPAMMLANKKITFATVSHSFAPLDLNVKVLAFAFLMLSVFSALW